MRVLLGFGVVATACFVLIFRLESGFEDLAEGTPRDLEKELPEEASSRNSATSLNNGDTELSHDTREELAKMDSDHYFNLERSIKDRDYAMKVRKSTRILQYLDAPRRGDPNYEAVLHTLLRNGFGIEDWVTTCSTIMQWYLPAHIRRENLKQLGYTQEEIEENLRKMNESRQGDYDRIKEALLHDVGITDLSVRDELMAIPVLAENREAPFGRHSFDPYEGDRLLTDDDWMTPEHRNSQALYQGAPRERMTELERIAF